MTLQPDSTLDLSTGSLASSYPDLRWDGNILRVQVGAVLVPGAAASSAASLFASMTELDAQNDLQNAAASLVNSITPATNTLFVAWTNTTVYYPSKVLVTSVGNGSITLEYYTYDYTTGPPAISGVQNNSSLVAGLPNSGIAPSSIIMITGSRLSDPNVALQLQDSTQGLPLTLNGTSLSVTVNETTVQPAIYYATPTQVAAVLPAATPTGSGTITLSHGGFSTSGPIQIVPSAYGLDSTNSGTAVAQDAISYSLITYTSSAQPGEIITLWGTGLGADPADSDTTYTKTPHAIQTPVQVYVGNAPTGVLYSGASVYPGVDVIVFTIPDSLPTGCAVPITVVTGGSALSNTVTLPIMSGGGVCSDPQYGINGVLLSQNTFNSAMLSVYEVTGAGSLFGPPTISLDATANIQQVTPTSLNLQPSLGGCVGPGNGSNSYPPGLEAGTITASGDGYGPLTLMPAASGAPGSYFGLLAGPAFALAPPAAGMVFTFAASGGAQVGAFTASVSYPNPGFSSTATMAGSGLQFNWSGAATNAYITISASASTRVGSSYLSFGFECTAPAGDGQFTVPDYLLLGLPSGASFQSAQVSNISYSVFSASGLDLGLVTAPISVAVKIASP